MGRRKPDIADYAETVRSLSRGEYRIAEGETYTNCKVKIVHIHEKCNSSFPMTPDRFKAGNRCPKCSRAEAVAKSRMGEEGVRQVLTEALGESYEILSTGHASVHEKVSLRHECGHEYSVLIRHVAYDGNRCPVCSTRTSQGEERIVDWLESRKIGYKRQYSDPRCKSAKGRRLSFDFLVPYEDGSFCLIEYDGEQHFSPASKGGVSEEGLAARMMNDEAKNRFCEENGIPLLRISYKEINRVCRILEAYFFGD